MTSPTPISTLGSPDAATSADPPARSVWLTTLYYNHGWDHGGHLRIFAIAREWVRRGAEVRFIALRFERDDPRVTRAYLERLVAERIITGFDELVLRHPVVRGKLARGALVPALRDVVLGPERRAMLADLEAIARQTAPDLFVYAARHLLFAIPHLRRHAPVVVDWGDFYGLYHRRLLGAAVGRRDLRLAVRSLWNMADSGLTERRYSRAADVNVFVSPVDAQALARVAGPPAVVRTVANGIGQRPERATGPRTPGRLIFTGVMDFPPNHYAAVWFIQHVLPHVVARRPDVRFVVAGSNPQPGLRALAGPNVEVTGWVDDMRAELARSALYVAPMTSGSGFKNKVVEALAAGLHVVGTSYAFEFLPDRLRALFTPADDPERLADAVVAALENPAGNDQTVERFWQLAGDEYDWGHIADRFAAAVQPAAAQRP